MLIVFLVLCGCGSRRASPHVVAVVDGQSISRIDFRQYQTYTQHFYAWADRGNPGASTLRCNGRAPSPTCARLAKQVLRRLVEERVILRYAQLHHIALRAADLAAVDREAAAPAGGSGSSPLYRALGVSRTFLRAVLAREILVRRVEDAVAPAGAKTGLSLRVRKIALPIPSPARQDAVYRQAVRLATDGQPLPPAAAARVEWVAPFRLPAQERAALAVARPGEYTGPFAYQGAYLVIQLLERARHTYGTPARQTLETRFFRSWVQAHVRAADPKCFTPDGAPEPCPR